MLAGDLPEMVRHGTAVSDPLEARLKEDVSGFDSYCRCTLSDVIKLLYHSLGLSPGHWADFLQINKDILSCSDAIQTNR